jgi:hypothetical protein
MTIQVADLLAHVQMLVSVVKTMTVLEEYTTKEQRSVMCLLWTKGLNVKDIHKLMFSVYGGKCLSRKAAHNWAQKFSRERSKVADDAQPGVEVAETTVKRLLCCGFALVKRWDRCIDVGGGCVEKCHFRVRISHVVRFISICDLFTDCPSYVSRYPISELGSTNSCIRYGFKCTVINIILPKSLKTEDYCLLGCDIV